MDGRRMPCRLAWILLSTSLVVTSCGRRSPNTLPAAPADDEFSVMTYNLLAYTLEDRDQDGQDNDPKPEAERNAVISLIAEVEPDVLAIQEIGSPLVFKEFRYALQDAGLTYEHVEYLRRGTRDKNLAVLSRFPIVSRQSRTDDTYSIGKAEVPVARGFIDVDLQVSDTYTLRLMVAHLKSKVFHALGQTEMRRNEARLLGKHVRNAMKDKPELNLLVVGDMNDTYASAALREIIGKKEKYLVDLRPVDPAGDVWTHFSTQLDAYQRIDYVLASRPILPELVREKTFVVRSPLTHIASDHRPVVAVFKAWDVAVAGSPKH